MLLDTYMGVEDWSFIAHIFKIYNNNMTSIVKNKQKQNRKSPSLHDPSQLMLRKSMLSDDDLLSSKIFITFN